MAPLMRGRKKALVAAAPVINPADRLSMLPVEILAHILSFLPAQEAVRTCVVARRWRHAEHRSKIMEDHQAQDVWKLTPRLIITGKSVKEVQVFVDRLLHVRRDGLKRASLSACAIRFDLFEAFGDDYDDTDGDLDVDDTSSLHRWIRCVLKCQIQKLQVDISARTCLGAYLHMNTSTLVSRHLTRLELTGIMFICRCVDLDGCPVLEHLEINECCLAHVRRITSMSVKHLDITSCESSDNPHRFRICAPRLVSLWLDAYEIKAPLLEIMPELEKAYVCIHSYLDGCRCDEPFACDHVMRDGDSTDTQSDNDFEEDSDGYAGQNSTECVVLQGLADARELELISGSTYVFRRDLRWCPTFPNLKTLVLNEYWCVPANCHALACILQHAPVLEKLTIQFSNKVGVVLEGRSDATAISNMISQHLKTVEIKCYVLSDKVQDVLKFLSKLNIWFQFRVTEGSN